MAQTSETNRPRSDNDSWTLVDRSQTPSSMSATISATMNAIPSGTPRGESIESDTLSRGESIESNTLGTGTSSSKTDTINADEVASEAFTVTSVPGGGPPRGSFSSPVTLIEVGRDFWVHSGVLCFYSEFFKSMAHGLMPFDHIAIPSEIPNTFEVFVHWMYTRDLPEDQSKDTSSSSGKLGTRIMCELWVFGAKYDIPQLQKDMVTKIVERVMHSAWKNPNSHIAFVYEYAPNSKLLKLVMDLNDYSVTPRQVIKVKKFNWTEEKEADVSSLETSLPRFKELLLWDLREYH